MAKEIIIESKNLKLAKKEASEKLGVDESNLSFDIIEERKGLFKKSYIKVKFYLNEKRIEEKIEKTHSDTESIIKEERVKDTAFSVDFEEDGVYLYIKNKRDNLESEILEYLEKKQIKNINKDLITKDNIENNNMIKIAEPQREVKLDGDIKVEISKDKMEGFITLIEPLGGEKLTINKALEKIKEQNLKFGTDKEKLKNIIDNELYDSKVLIAKGKEPVAGKDGYLKKYVNIESKANPHISEDGKIDFKKLDLIKNVEKGQLLVEAIPPEKGEVGKNVLGQEIQPKEGKTAQIKYGKNTVISEDKSKLYSSENGQVLLFDNKVIVNKVYEVPANVDNTTGNIDFNGKVVIKGNVRSGFKVKAEGDIEVHGVVEGAELISSMDIILSKGVQGNNQAVLRTKGNVVAKYIENTTIKADGNIEADAILHSNIISKSEIIVGGKKGLIVGGNVKARDLVSAEVIGSHMGTITNVEVGIDPEEKEFYDTLLSKNKEIEKNILNVVKTVDLLNKMKQKGALPKDKELLLKKSINTLDSLNKEKEKNNKDIEKIKFKMENAVAGKVKASRTIYPGVKVRILGSVRHIYDELSHSTLYLKEGDIVIGPYEN